MKLHLILPTNQLREPFLRMLEEYKKNGELIHSDDYSNADFDFEQYIHKLYQHSKGLGLPIGYVPYTTYWLTDDDETEVYGTSRLRHELCEFLYTEGGHIGYDVHPLHRQQGYGTKLCRLTLIEAKKIGIDRVLLICESDNIGSKRIIEESGGVLQDEIISPISRKPTLRYWIQT